MIETIIAEKEWNKKRKVSKKQIALTKAFGFAFYGWFLFIKRERNGQIQLAIAVLAIACSIALHISEQQWITVLFCIAAVLSLEMLNTAVEKLCDLVHPGYHPTIKVIKDVSAAAVLWTSIISAIIGSLIFLPKILSLCFPGSHV